MSFTPTVIIPWAAVGHPAAYTIDGKDYLVFHAYNKKDGGKPKLMIREIKWEGTRG